MRTLLKRYLPLSFRQAIGNLINWMDVIAIRFFSVNGFSASAYYFLLSRRFDREHLAVLRGRLAYRQSLSDLRHSSTLLRRNIHRLEKGLIMRPRRDVFGEGFIVETVRCFNLASQSVNFSKDELRWATDVLNEYFEVVGSSNVISQAMAEYGSGGAVPQVEGDIECNKSKPYPLASLPASNVTFDALHGLFYRRRSVRWYQPKVVPMEIIRKVVNAATLAPSACNRQPFRFVVSNDTESTGKIAACAGGTIGFAENFPAVVVVVGDLSAYPKERDRHLIYIDSALASMQLMLAAETLGLSTCPINWPDVDRSELQMHRLLKLPRNERVIMLIAIGYGDPSGQIPFSQKKSDALLVEEFAPE